MNTTIEYYEENAEQFSAGTVSVDFSAVQNRFCVMLPPGALILDFGCGSGRDTKFFTEKGFSVEACDGSAKLCEIAEANTGIKVKHMLFSELAEVWKYDGIWACASVLHLSKKELKSVLVKTAEALKPEGILYTSFKYGTFEGLRNGRYFTDFTEEGFRDFITDMDFFRIRELWISEDVRPGRETEKWLNLILVKKQDFSSGQKQI